MSTTNDQTAGHRPDIERFRARSASTHSTGFIAQPPLLASGRNCWRLARAQRAAWLIDAQAYYAAFREAVRRATQSIFIIAWDIDSRTVLPPQSPTDRWPALLGDFLNAAVSSRRGLHAYVLDWDFIMLYQTDRELLPRYALGWRTHHRLRFELDGEHPVGGSHHQKIVVIDDSVAFVGGLDLTNSRWDTPDHTPGDPLRRAPGGASYPPFHDVQLMVDGEAAAALGELARARWRRSTGRRIPGPEPAKGDPWPLSVAPHFRDVEVGIARTEPRYQSYPEVQEVKRLYLDAIAAARATLYIENQYLTAPAIVDALARRLAEPDGPEIVIVSRLRGGGWLEESTMTVLRVRMIQALQAADVHGRLRIYYPHRAGLGEECINVHSKVMVVDDRLLRVGSANLNNRSMGYDTECDLAIEATCARTAHGIAQFRDTLLAEHLGSSPDAVAERIRQHGSLIRAIESLRGGARTLEPLEADAATPPLIVDPAMVDPERPVPPDALAARLVPPKGPRRAARRMVGAAVLLVAIAALAAAWRWTPLAHWLDLSVLEGIAERLRESDLAPVLVLGAYVVASAVAIPITLVILATAAVFGPVSAFLYGITGSVLGATATYWLGHALGRDAVRRVAGSRLSRLSRRLARRGLLAVIAVRLVPVAPFTVVNLAAGASHIGLRDFVLGTFFGMLPGMFAISVFSDRVLAALHHPSPLTIATLVAVVLLIAAAAVFLSRWLKRRANRNGRDEAGSGASDETGTARPGSPRSQHRSA